jgi:hypothetical protein
MFSLPIFFKIIFRLLKIRFLVTYKIINIIDGNKIIRITISASPSNFDTFFHFFSEKFAENKRVEWYFIVGN